MSGKEDTIAVPLNYYKELLRDSAILGALTDAGVDNWEWYGDAIEAAEKALKNRNDLIES